MASTPPPLVLSPIVTDYYGIQAALESDLIAAPSGSWTNLAPAGTGSAIIRWIASVGSMNQGALARSLQENYPDTARSPSAILRAARLQGINPIRARAGQIQLSVTRTDSSLNSLAIPAYTQWNINGQPFVNRVAFTLSASGAAVSTTLNRGLVTTETHTSDGSAFQSFILGSSGLWNISNDDLWMVDSSGVTWTPITTGLWREPSGSTTFFASTIPDGRVECKFGDGNYAGLPAAGTLTFGYTVLDTAQKTSTPPPVGSTATAAGYAVVATVTSSSFPTANQDAPPPSFYKAIGPGGAANNQRAVTRDDCRAEALQYPGVVDALFQGQAEINPSDLRWMNVLTVTLITTTPWSPLQWLNFKNFMESERTCAGFWLVRLDPTPVHITLPVSIAALSIADLNSVTSLTQAAVTAFFAVQAGSLGGSYAYSDIIVAVMEACTYQAAPNETGPLLDTVSCPADAITLAPTQYFVLDSCPITAAYTTRKSSAASLDVIVGQPIISPSNPRS